MAVALAAKSWKKCGGKKSNQYFFQLFGKNMENHGKVIKVLHKYIVKNEKSWALVTHDITHVWGPSAYLPLPPTAYLRAAVGQVVGHREVHSASRCRG